MDENYFKEKLRRIEALFAGAATAGERDAAGAARERILLRLKELQDHDPSTEWKFTLHDSWDAKVFCSLCRRYDRAARMRRHPPRKRRRPSRRHHRHRLVRTLTQRRSHHLQRPRARPRRHPRRWGATSRARAARSASSRSAAEGRSRGEKGGGRSAPERRCRGGTRQTADTAMQYERREPVAVSAPKSPHRSPLLVDIVTCSSALANVLTLWACGITACFYRREPSQLHSWLLLGAFGFNVINAAAWQAIDLAAFASRRNGALAAAAIVLVAAAMAFGSVPGSWRPGC